MNNAAESDEVTFVTTISPSDANKICSQEKENVHHYLSSESASPAYNAFADVVMRRDYNKLLIHQVLI